MANNLVGTLVVKLVGDGSDYQKILNSAVKNTKKFNKQITKEAGAGLTASLKSSLGQVVGQFSKSFASVMGPSAVVFAVGTKVISAAFMGLLKTAKFVVMGILNSFKVVGEVLVTVGRRIKRLGTSLTVGLSAPIIAFGGFALKTFASFESSLAKIQGLVGINKDLVAGFGEEILKLSPRVSRGPLELAEAMFFITSAGLRGRDALEALEFAAKGSTIGLGETKVVADLLTSAMNAYGPTVLDAGGATDILVATVREGKAEADALAGAMGHVIPIASAMGVEFNEVGAAIAAMTRSGTAAQTSTIQLRQILAAMLNPSKQARTQLEEFGLSAAGIRKELREKGLLSVLTTLTKTFEGNEEAIGRVFGNIRALAGVMNIMGKNVAKTRGIFERMETTLGDTNKALESVVGTIEFKWNQNLARMQVLQVKVGKTLKELFLPSFEKLGEVLENVTAQWDRLTPNTRKQVANFIALFAVLGPLVFVIGTLVAAIGTLFSMFGSLLVIVPLAISALVVGLNLIGIAGVGGVFEALKDWDGTWEDAFVVVKKFSDKITLILSNFENTYKKTTAFINNNWMLIWKELGRFFNTVLDDMRINLLVFMGRFRDILVIGVKEAVLEITKEMEGNIVFDFLVGGSMTKEDIARNQLELDILKNAPVAGNIKVPGEDFVLDPQLKANIEQFIKDITNPEAAAAPNPFLFRGQEVFPFGAGGNALEAAQEKFAEEERDKAFLEQAKIDIEREEEEENLKAIREGMDALVELQRERNAQTLELEAAGLRPF